MLPGKRTVPFTSLDETSRPAPSSNGASLSKLRKMFDSITVFEKDAKLGDNEECENGAGTCGSGDNLNQPIYEPDWSHKFDSIMKRQTSSSSLRSFLADSATSLTLSSTETSSIHRRASSLDISDRSFQMKANEDSLSFHASGLFAFDDEHSDDDSIITFTSISVPKLRMDSKKDTKRIHEPSEAASGFKSTNQDLTDKNCRRRHLKRQSRGSRRLLTGCHGSKTSLVETIPSPVPEQGSRVSMTPPRRSQRTSLSRSSTTKSMAANGR